MNKLVSVIITAYNSTELLAEALRSAEAQIHPSLEIVAVDDGSCADRAAYIEAAVAHSPRARLVRQENQGLSAARNRGAEESSGHYLAFLDHDDLWEPEFLSTLVSKLESDARIGAVFCRIQHINSQGVPTGRISKGKLSGFSVRDFLISDPLCCGSSFVVRREAFASVSGFDGLFRRAETPEFFIRFLDAGWLLEGVDRSLVRYRNTPGSLSSGWALKADRKRLLQQTFKKHPRLASSLSLRMGMLANQLRIQLRRFLIQ